MDAERGEMLELQRRMQQQQAHIQGDIMAINTRYQMENQRTQMISQLELQSVQQEMQTQMQNEMQQKQQAQMANVGAGGPPPPGLPNGAMTGDQVMPGFPQGATAYALNGARTPQTGVAPWVAAQGGSRDGQQMDMSYVAKRAANYIRKLDPESQQQALMRMSSANPQLFQMVQQILLAGQGQQADGLNPMQMPLPQQRPQRRDPIRRLGG